ncbi:MAG: hypothetical protein JXM70_18525 [Pirellulales bacterium]|nr:hypothetical protein [Pirellulales bacterium]
MFYRTCIWIAFVTTLTFAHAPRTASAEGRRIISLDGPWQIAEGTMDRIPDEFNRTVPVPGLVDMAQPPFENVGVNEKDELREAFWYRREFRVDGNLPEVARLKIHKAKYGTRVFLNGQLVGDHLPCFTPAVLDVRKYLKGSDEPNVLIVRVGSCRDSIPKSIPDGHDFEKIRYIPGIYDSVELIISGNPYIERVQTVPDLENKAVRVVATLRNSGKATGAVVRCSVCEVSTGKLVGQAEAKPVHIKADAEQKVEFTIPIEGCRLWSPEDPFLYRLETTSGTDTFDTRFGMRTFRFDPKTKLAVLNGKTYPLRGTNICIYRFFEDPGRGNKPWSEDWVRRLHSMFKYMHWNSIRYCIGFPPERWYDIADELGIMIHDEFPIWYGGKWEKQLKSEQLVKEYSEWMRERWNHPSVVVWDAQNESVTEETGKAIHKVRDLDLSDRPWDNGYGMADRATDTFEAHPYLYYSPAAKKGSKQDTWNRIPSTYRQAKMAVLPKLPGEPGGGCKGNFRENVDHNPVVINEYGWLWLNRDGSPTTLTKANYDAWLGSDATPNQRRELWNRYLAAMTEHWRSYRKVAAVQHFCSLAYSRPTGQTSDHLLDVDKLTLEPNFVKYVRDAFAPVGLMIDHWAEEIPAGKGGDVSIAVINDLEKDWQGKISFRVTRDGTTISEESQTCTLKPIGRQTLVFKNALPTESGKYELTAELRMTENQPVRSRRKVTVLPKVAN